MDGPYSIVLLNLMSKGLIVLHMFVDLFLNRNVGEPISNLCFGRLESSPIPNPPVLGLVFQ
jgi:hypothetical protein